eukprot:gnl/TRDRNA2_/TRDRNA2_181008_c0_seq1.p2 gnl/TRDRNA2_/TRDRNA2_181008_c0~~gnl/TRDRNA2_/TRDRNA2_181008_c0_seq1.p2  ORF type:complete len:188 (-),score=39.72 gnl/TRDRNA2_/TRDRNA2_181008_c0_seq1:102-590(-)
MAPIAGLLRGALRCRSGLLPAASAAARGRWAPVSIRYFSDVRFTKTHEWVLNKDGTATIGISDYAQNQLGEVVYVDLPDVGGKFDDKQTIVTLESVKAVGEVYSPASCEVLEVNERLSEEPALVNSSPEENGWLVKVKVDGDIADLMDSAAYTKHVDESSHE